MKIRKFMWKFLSIAVICAQMLIANLMPVNAGLSIISRKTGIQFVSQRVKNGVIYQFIYKDLPLYCIEPESDFSSQDVYEQSALDEYEKLSSEDIATIAEYSYFGYGYQDHTSKADIAATQYLIWLKILPSFVTDTHFFNASDGADRDDEVYASVNRILQDVEQYHREPDFNVRGAVQKDYVGKDYKDTGNAGSQFILEDQNGILSTMYLTRNDFGSALQQNSNTLTIRLSNDTAGEKTIEFKRNQDTVGERPLVFRDVNRKYQALSARGDVNKGLSIQLTTNLSADIRKVDVNGNQLSGAALEVHDISDDHLVDAWVSDAAVHSVAGLINGHQYEIREVSAPQGYYFAQPQRFDPLSAASVSFTDEKIDAHIHKEDEYRHPLAGAVMKITDETDGRTMQYTTTNDPYDCSAFLKADHAFRLSELQAPAGYYPAEDQTFTIPHDPASAPIAIHMEDHSIQYAVEKKDENNHPVKDAVLALYDVTQEQRQQMLRWTTGTEAQNIGSLLQAGHSYCIVEEAASTRYFLAVDTKFTVPLQPSDTPVNLTIEDDHIHYEFQKLDDYGNPVKNAHLRITDITDPLDEERIVLDWQSSDDPLSVNLLERGHTYRIQELETPDGYYSALDKIFKVPEHGSREPIAITIQDDLIVYHFSKVDDLDQPVRGAELTIFEKLGQEEIPIRVFTTDQQPVTVYGLKADTDYVLRETKVPQGYYKAEDIPFHVGSSSMGANHDIIMEEDKISFTVDKVDENGNRIKDAELAVYELNTEKEVARWITAEQMQDIGAALQAGTSYILKEEKVPAGYYRAEDIVFTIPEIKEDHPASVIMIDDAIHVEVEKKDQTGKSLAGAHFQLMHEQNVVTEWISNEVPQDISAYLTSGESYEIVETQAPDGFYEAEPRKFNVGEEKEDQLITIKDLPVQYEIAKVDEQGNPVAGVQLQLSETVNGQKTILRQWITAEENEKFDAVLIAGHSYLLEESEMVAGYQLAQSMSFTVSRQGPIHPIVLSMVDETNAIAFKKIDEAGSPLAGAEMEILDETGDRITSFLSSDDQAGSTTDQTGRSIASYLMNGSNYVLHEKKAPFGYELCEDIPFTMTGTIQAPQTITAVDAAKTIYLRIDKRSAEEGMPLLSDCEITVFNASSKEPAYDLNGEEARGLTKEDGAVEFNLPYTTDGYYVQETKAPQGFAIDERPKELQMSQTQHFDEMTPQQIHVVDHKTVNTGVELPAKGFFALLCAIGCVILLKKPDEKM